MRTLGTMAALCALVATGLALLRRGQRDRRDRAGHQGPGRRRRRSPGSARCGSRSREPPNCARPAEGRRLSWRTRGRCPTGTGVPRPLARAGRRCTQTQVIDGDKGWVQVGDIVQDMPKESLAEMKEQKYGEDLDRFGFPE